MKERREKIAQGLADAEKAKAALADAAKERDKILQDASAEAYRLLQTAREEAERLRAAALERAGHDAERVIEEARGRHRPGAPGHGDAPSRACRSGSPGRILEKVVQGLFSEDERARIVARGLERIGSTASADSGSK